jgi:glutamyl-tRNA reductase
MKSLGLFLLGASHRTTPLELREKLALTPARLTAFYAVASTLPGLGELTILNTCNRVEFYGHAASADTVTALQAAFCEFQQLPADVFASISRQSDGLAAIEHLLSVAAGLDSQMLGETEILGQLKTAYATAQSQKTTGPVLNRLFQKIFQHAKYVRTHSAITSGHISVANVAVELALKIFGDLANTRILLLGAGDIAEKTAKAFQSCGAGSLTIASRTHGRAMELASGFDATALPWEHLATHLGDYSIVVGSTSAPEVVVTRAQTEVAMRKRRAEPLFFIDLALPRDIEPTVTDLDNVFLYNLDDLAKIAEANLAARAAKVAHARVLVCAKAAALWQQLALGAGS